MATNSSSVTNLAIPTVHLDGTSPGELVVQVREAHSAICKALAKLYVAAPDGRDYISDNSSIDQAAKQHVARLEHLFAVLDELEQIWSGINAQVH